MLGKSKFERRELESKKESFDNAVDNYDARLERKGSSKYGPTTNSDDGDWDTDIEEDFQANRFDLDSTGRQMYLQSCKFLNILPSAIIADALGKSNLRISHGTLGAKEIRSITAALIGNTHVKALDLQANQIDFDGTRMIRYLLQENFHISDLNIADNKIGNIAAEEIGKMIKETQCLVKLNIGGNLFDDRRSQYIANSIALNNTLKTLNLSHNQFRSSAGRDFGMALEMNKTINELDFSWNSLRMDGAAAFANGLAWNTGLVSLNLSFNGFADIGAAAMGKALVQNNTLKWLDLSYNRITDKGAKSLSNGLANNKRLKSLNISYNPITKEGGLSILVAAKEAKEIVELLLEEIYLESKAISIIQEILRERRKLTVTYKGVARDTEYMNPTKNLDALKSKIFKIIQEYLKEKNLRMLDLFNTWDRDKSLTLTADEFVLGCRNAKIPLTLEMIDVLMQSLDKNKNGQIDYQEFVAVSKLT